MLTFFIDGFVIIYEKTNEISDQILFIDKKFVYCDKENKHDELCIKIIMNPLLHRSLHKRSLSSSKASVQMPQKVNLRTILKGRGSCKNLLHEQILKRE